MSRGRDRDDDAYQEGRPRRSRDDDWDDDDRPRRSRDDDYDDRAVRSSAKSGVVTAVGVFSIILASLELILGICLVIGGAAFGGMAGDVNRQVGGQAPAGILGAIAGITLDRVPDVIAAGADGVALISSLFRASDIATTAQAFRKAVDDAIGARK